jgi:hypothetical protein
VKLGGTGYVPGIVAHTGQRGLFYARTDMGGAYRYQATTSTWIPLNGWVPATNGNQLGIETIAVDPRDASRLYMAGCGSTTCPAARGRTSRRPTAPRG